MKTALKKWVPPIFFAVYFVILLTICIKLQFEIDFFVNLVVFALAIFTTI